MQLFYNIIFLLFILTHTTGLNNNVATAVGPLEPLAGRILALLPKLLGQLLSPLLIPLTTGLIPIIGLVGSFVVEPIITRTPIIRNIAEVFRRGLEDVVLSHTQFLPYVVQVVRLSAEAIPTILVQIPKTVASILAFLPVMRIWSPLVTPIVLLLSFLNSFINLISRIITNKLSITTLLQTLVLQFVIRKSIPILLDSCLLTVRTFFGLILLLPLLGPAKYIAIPFIPVLTGLLVPILILIRNVVIPVLWLLFKNLPILTLLLFLPSTPLLLPIFLLWNIQKIPRTLWLLLLLLLAGPLIPLILPLVPFLIPILTPVLQFIKILIKGILVIPERLLPVALLATPLLPVILPFILFRLTGATLKIIPLTLGSLLLLFRLPRFLGPLLTIFLPILTPIIYPIVISVLAIVNFVKHLPWLLLIPGILLVPIVTVLVLLRLPIVTFRTIGELLSLAPRVSLVLFLLSRLVPFKLPFVLLIPVMTFFTTPIVFIMEKLIGKIIKSLIVPKLRFKSLSRRLIQLITAVPRNFVSTLDRVTSFAGPLKPLVLPLAIIPVALQTIPSSILKLFVGPLLLRVLPLPFIIKRIIPFILILTPFFLLGIFPLVLLFSPVNFLKLLVLIPLSLGVFSIPLLPFVPVLAALLAPIVTLLKLAAAPLLLLLLPILPLLLPTKLIFIRNLTRLVLVFSPLLIFQAIRVFIQLFLRFGIFTPLLLPLLPVLLPILTVTRTILLPFLPIIKPLFLLIASLLPFVVFLRPWIIGGLLPILVPLSIVIFVLLIPVLPFIFGPLAPIVRPILAPILAFLLIIIVRNVFRFLPLLPALIPLLLLLVPLVVTILGGMLPLITLQAPGAFIKTLITLSVVFAPLRRVLFPLFVLISWVYAPISVFLKTLLLPLLFIYPPLVPFILTLVPFIIAGLPFILIGVIPFLIPITIKTIADILVILSLIAGPLRHILRSLIILIASRLAPVFAFGKILLVPLMALVGVTAPFLVPAILTAIPLVIIGLSPLILWLAPIMRGVVFVIALSTLGIFAIPLLPILPVITRLLGPIVTLLGILFGRNIGVILLGISFYVLVKFTTLPFFLLGLVPILLFSVPKSYAQLTWLTTLILGPLKLFIWPVVPVIKFILAPIFSLVKIVLLPILLSPAGFVLIPVLLILALFIPRLIRGLLPFFILETLKALPVVLVATPFLLGIFGPVLRKLSPIIILLITPIVGFIRTLFRPFRFVLLPLIAVLPPLYFFLKAMKPGFVLALLPIIALLAIPTLIQLVVGISVILGPLRWILLPITLGISVVLTPIVGLIKILSSPLFLLALPGLPFAFPFLLKYLIKWVIVLIGLLPALLTTLPKHVLIVNATITLALGFLGPLLRPVKPILVWLIAPISAFIDLILSPLKAVLFIFTPFIIPVIWSIQSLAIFVVLALLRFIVPLTPIVFVLLFLFVRLLLGPLLPITKTLISALISRALSPILVFMKLISIILHVIFAPFLPFLAPIFLVGKIIAYIALIGILPVLLTVRPINIILSTILLPILVGPKALLILPVVPLIISVLGSIITYLKITNVPILLSTALKVPFIIPIVFLLFFTGPILVLLLGPLVLLTLPIVFVGLLILARLVFGRFLLPLLLPVITFLTPLVPAVITLALVGLSPIFGILQRVLIGIFPFAAVGLLGPFLRLFPKVFIDLAIASSISFGTVAPFVLPFVFGFVLFAVPLVTIVRLLIAPIFLLVLWTLPFKIIVIPIVAVFSLFKFLIIPFELIRTALRFLNPLRFLFGLLRNAQLTVSLPLLLPLVLILFPINFALISLILGPISILVPFRRVIGAILALINSILIVSGLKLIVRTISLIGRLPLILLAPILLPFLGFRTIRKYKILKWVLLIGLRPLSYVLWPFIIILAYNLAPVLQFGRILLVSAVPRTLLSVIAPLASLILPPVRSGLIVLTIVEVFLGLGYLLRPFTPFLIPLIIFLMPFITPIVLILKIVGPITGVIVGTLLTLARLPFLAISLVLGSFISMPITFTKILRGALLLLGPLGVILLPLLTVVAFVLTPIVQVIKFIGFYLIP